MASLAKDRTIGDERALRGWPTSRDAVVRAAWDDEAKVWYMQEADIPGLVTEAETLEELRRKMPLMMQDLVEDRDGRPGEIEIDFLAYAHDRGTIEA